MFNLKGNTMTFKDKKEFYSLRKFKGIGLASALIGLAFVSTTVNANENVDVNDIHSSSIVNKVNSDIIIKEPKVEQSAVTTPIEQPKVDTLTTVLVNDQLGVDKSTETKIVEQSKTDVINSEVEKPKLETSVVEKSVETPTIEKPRLKRLLDSNREVTDSDTNIPQPSGNVIASGEDGVPWDLYENGYLLFKPEAGKDTLTNDGPGKTSWKVNHGSKINYVGFTDKVYAPSNSWSLFSRNDAINRDYKFEPSFIESNKLDVSNV